MATGGGSERGTFLGGHHPNPPPKFYADASALIGLARIGRLDLLRILPIPVYVTDGVWAEVTTDPTKLGAEALQQAREEGLVTVVSEGDPDAFPQLDPGESTVLSAAAAAHASVVVDERRARDLIDREPAIRDAIDQVAGVVGLVLLAKRLGYVPAVRPVLDELMRQQFWISTRLYEDVLREAGELV